MQNMLTFQDVILRLQEFWNRQGCVLLQPYDIEVGAGTFHTATFLRSIGPEPWSAAYVQPSRRPADGRYGDNPNRLQQFHQFQVILKPAPDEVQQLYLQSLEACGIDLRAHLAPHALVLSLQNGVDNAERLQASVNAEVQAWNAEVDRRRAEKKARKAQHTKALHALR